MRSNGEPQRHKVHRVPFDYLNPISEKTIGSCIEVHKHLGPGLLESIYEKALCQEFQSRGIRFKNQHPVPVHYKGHDLGLQRLDFLVEDEVIVELKAVDRIDPVFKAQLLSYMRLAKKRLGLLINFNVPVLKQGVRRLVL